MAEPASRCFRLTDRGRNAEYVAIFSSNDPSDETIHIVVHTKGRLMALNRHSEPLRWLISKYQWSDVQHHPAVQKQESNKCFPEAGISGDAVWLDLDCAADL